MKLRDLFGVGFQERPGPLERVYAPRTPRILAENVVIAYMLGLVCGVIGAVVVIG